MEILKTWKPRPISIGEFEDLWEENKRFEVAKQLILVLKEAEDISLKEKVRFLGCLVDESLYHGGSKLMGSEKDIRNRELKALATRTFLELAPTWNDEFERECRIIVRSLGRISAEQREGWENKIKTFLHSLLNTKKKETMKEIFLEDVSRALINNQMFKELVNYDFSDDRTIDGPFGLKGFLFGDKDGYLSVSTQSELRNPEVFRRKIIDALKENQEPHVQHALSVLLRLLAKRGDLEKIFQVE